MNDDFYDNDERRSYPIEDVLYIIDAAYDLGRSEARRNQKRMRKAIKYLKEAIGEETLRWREGVNLEALEWKLMRLEIEDLPTCKKPKK